MANNILSNTIHIFPTVSPDSANTYFKVDENVTNYMDDIKNFFINTLGFYQYGDRKIFKKNKNIFIDYFSYIENGSPIFCIRNANVESYPETFYLAPCTYDGIEYIPINTDFYDTSQNTGSILSIKSASSDKVNNSETIMFNYYRLSSNNTICLLTDDIIIQDIKFKDGKRAIFFKDRLKNSNVYRALGYRAVLFYTDIIYKNQIIKDWVFFTLNINTSYNPEFQQHIANINLGEKKYCFYIPNISTLEKMGGIIPGKNLGKEYLIKQNFYIGNDAYIPDIYRFSNIVGVDTKKGLMGDIVTIKNKEYLILYNGFRVYEDNNLKTLDPGVTNNQYTTDTYDNQIKHTLINTESLLVPL